MTGFLQNILSVFFFVLIIRTYSRMLIKSMVQCYQSTVKINVCKRKRGKREKKMVRLEFMRLFAYSHVLSWLLSRTHTCLGAAVLATGTKKQQYVYF